MSEHQERIDKFARLLAKTESLVSQIRENEDMPPEQKHYDGKVSIMMRDYFAAKHKAARIEAEIMTNRALEDLRPIIEDLK